MSTFLRLTLKLYPYKMVFIGAMFLCVAIIIYCFVTIAPSDQNSIITPYLLGFVWSLLGYSTVIYAHTYSLQKLLPIDVKPSLIQRIKATMQRWFFMLFSFIFVGLTLAIIFFTYRILMIA